MLSAASGPRGGNQDVGLLHTDATPLHSADSDSDSDIDHVSVTTHDRADVLLAEDPLGDIGGNLSLP